MSAQEARKISGAKGVRSLGFTLLEVLVSLVLLGVGLAFATRVFVAGKYYMKAAENKSQAIEIANMKMNEYLSKGYTDLNTLYAADPTITGIESDIFNWTVTLTKRNMTQNPASKGVVPYFEIEVVCSYDEPDVNGVVVQKKVGLFNIVVYPYIHILTNEFPSTADDEEASNAATWNPIQEIGVLVNVTTTSDLLVFYNIALDTTDTDALTADDLVITKAHLVTCGTSDRCDRNGSGVLINYDAAHCADPAVRPTYPIQTGTPILSQASISNTVSINSVAPGEYIAGVEWTKTTAASTVIIKRANIIVLQVEE